MKQQQFVVGKNLKPGMTVLGFVDRPFTYPVKLVDRPIENFDSTSTLVRWSVKSKAGWTFNIRKSATYEVLV